MIEAALSNVRRGLQRAAAAFLAISARFFAESFAARAGPPFFPARRPSATAAGLFFGSGSGGFSAVASATILAASWFHVAFLSVPATAHEPLSVRTRSS